MTDYVPRRPFAGAEHAIIVLPHVVDSLSEEEAGALSGLVALVRQEPKEFEVELGAPVRFALSDPGRGPRFLIGPMLCNPDISRYVHEGKRDAGLWFDRRQQVLVADAPNLEGIYDALNLMRTMAMTGRDSIVSSECLNLDEAISRIVDEVGWTYPAFKLRGLDWHAICARHIERVKLAADPLAVMQEWIAELQDGHTWVREKLFMPLTHSLWVTPDKAIFERIHKGTAAWEAGVRAGDELIGEDTAGWWRRANAPPHARPLVAGRRLLSGAPDAVRSFVTRSPSGEQRKWSEAPTGKLPFPLVSWSRLPTGTGYVRVEAWRADGGIDDAIDAAFSDFSGLDRLIVDLRGNTGGNLLLAQSFRDRFLRERTLLGTLSISTGTGELSEPEPIIGEPSVTHRRWNGAVRFLTDPLTFSASEDTLLGLQGLPHVRIVGEPSGGGSGRQRTLPLVPGQILMVSTALTYDRNGHCVEGAGIPVDIPVTPNRFVPDADDLVLRAADRSW